MKSISIVFVLLTLVSCGRKNVTKYVENPYDNSANDTRFTNIEDRLSVLETQVSENISQINGLAELAEQNQSDISTLGKRIRRLKKRTANLLTRMVVLEGYNTVSTIIDPCGDSSGYDEVLLRTSSGDLIAYFEVGGNRYLSVLGTGSYRTTDGSNCNFEVTSSGAVLHNVNGVLVSN